MQKKGELSRLAVNLLIGSLIIILGIVIWIILKGGSGIEQQIFTDENIDLKISQVKKVNDNTLYLTLKRGEGEGEFVGLSFAVSDGSLTEIVRVNTSMPENQTGNFSLNFVSMNASRIKKVSVTPIYLNEEGVEVIGNVKDEYVTPNTCSNYCPFGAQCGFNDCGMQCGSGCSSGYLCLNYKCIKQKTSSGGGGGSNGGSGGSDDGDDADPTCTDTCSSLVKQCGIQTICGSNVNCGACSTGYTCSTNSTCIKNPINCTDTCSTFGYNCGIKNICNISTNCGNCSTGFICNLNGLCECNSTCSSLGYQCGTRTVCGNSVNCGTCSTGYTCQTNGTCTQNPCTDTCSSLVKQCGTHTICGISTNCGTCSTGYTCSSGLCIPSCVPTTCAALARNCGTVSDGCDGTLTCGNYGGGCQTGYTCQVSNGTCMKDCVPTTCSILGRNCGTVSDGCGGTLNCGTCSTGYTCQTNGTCTQNPCTDTCSSLVKQCGVQNICGNSVNCGTCSTGYTCQVSNGTCMKDVAVSCNGVTCKSGEYCSNGVCLMNVTGKTYFVATNGNDNNPGTFSQPFYSWQRGVEVAQPGDIVYIRGGTWKPTSHVMVNGWETWAVGMFIDPKIYNIGSSGTKSSPIRYYNYPGEKPILDGSQVNLDSSFNAGIEMDNVEYLDFKGLTVENIYQRSSGSEAFGIGSFYSANLKFENMIVHDIDGRGFQHWSGAWTLWGNEWDNEPYYPSNFKSDNTSWINCDAYNLFDRYSDSPGNAADGFIAHGHYGNYHTFEGCRAWNYSDDGFNTFFEAYTTIKNCWAMSTNMYAGLGSWDIEANGYKMNGVNRNRIPNYQLFGENFVKVYNSIAANCKGSGLINNIDVYVDPENWPSNGLYYNNFGYLDWAAFWDGGANQGGTRTTVYKNNIAYKSTSTNPVYQVGIYNPSIYPHTNNTWRAKAGEDWPGWENNPAYNLDNSDFVSLDYLQLTLPRKADGSLPDITFGHLKQGSDLIDKGVVISGYHCSTSGAHPGENCREWYGAAPDLGAFESNY